MVLFVLQTYNEAGLGSHSTVNLVLFVLQTYKDTSLGAVLL